MGGTWLLISTGSDKLDDVRTLHSETFTTIDREPTPGELADALARLLGPITRRGDALAEARCYLVPLADMVDLGYVGAKVTYRTVRKADDG